MRHPKSAAGLAMLISAALTPPAAAEERNGILEPILMNTARAAHTATLLADGRVLVAGGFREEGTREIPLAGAELFDPFRGTFSAAGDLNEPRDGHTATLLDDGDVLMAGGWGSRDRLASAELYDHLSGEFVRVGKMGWPRQAMTATRLRDGRVLVAGGDSARGVPVVAAELYDPATRTFAPAASLVVGRSAATATLLHDGRVLLVGGISAQGRVLSSAEIYDPSTDTFVPTGSMSVRRYKHASALLPDGEVLVLGGSDERDWSGKYSSAEVYDPARGTFGAVPPLSRARFKMSDAAVALDSGAIVVGGGNSLIETFDPLLRRFSPGASLDDDYFFSAATRLQDDSVLITGGYTSRIQPTKKAWRVLPAGRP